MGAGQGARQRAAGSDCVFGGREDSSGGGDRFPERQNRSFEHCGQRTGADGGGAEGGTGPAKPADGLSVDRGRRNRRGDGRRAHGNFYRDGGDYSSCFCEGHSHGSGGGRDLRM